MGANLECLAYYSETQTSVWHVGGTYVVFGLRVLPLSRLVSGRLLRGFEVSVRAQDTDNYAYWCSTDLLTTARDVMRFLKGCVSEYLDQHVSADLSLLHIPNPYGGFLC